MNTCSKFIPASDGLNPLLAGIAFAMWESIMEPNTKRPIMSNPELVPITAQLGIEKARTCTVCLYAFWIDPEGKEVGLDTAVKTQPTLRKDDAKSKTRPAIMNLDQADGGSWATNHYEVAEGTVLKLWCAATQFSVSAGQAALVLLVSKDAPLNVVTVLTSQGPLSSHKQVQVQGRFWCLNADEAEERAEVPPLTDQCRKFAIPSFIEEMFEIHEAAPATDTGKLREQPGRTVDLGDVKTGGSVVSEVQIATRRNRRSIG